MTPVDARRFIEKAILPQKGTWADIGAGTGTFTQALQSILTDGKVLAVDKNPHVLWREFGHQSPDSPVVVEVVEADFTKAMDLPPLDGILIANALHYATDPLNALGNVLASLKAGGTFLLIEYETDKPRTPWVPHPVSFARFGELCSQVGLSQPELMDSRPSQYGYDRLYLARAIWSG